MLRSRAPDAVLIGPQLGSSVRDPKKVLAHLLLGTLPVTNKRSLGSSMRSGLCFLFVLAVAQTATAQAEPSTQVLLMLPFASHVGIVGRDEVQTTYTPGYTEVAPDGRVRTHPSWTSTPYSGDRTQYGLLGLSLGHDWMRTVRTELYAALIVMDDPRPRGLLGVRAGPVWRLLDRGASATGAALRLVPLGGIAYRGQMYEWIHASDWRGQRSLAVTVTPALEATYYSSRSLGWTIRLKPEFSYVIHQIGSPVWIESESGAHWDGYRWGLTGGIDLGVVF